MAGRAGGIPRQLADGVGGFLVDSVETCAERTLWLLRNPDQARALGASGRELVRHRFLLTRLLADELRLYGALLAAEPAEAQPPRMSDSAASRGTRCAAGVFCSEACRDEFEIDPERFSRSRPAA